MNRTLRNTIVATLASLAATPVPAQPVIKTDEHALRVVVLVIGHQETEWSPE